MSTDAAGPAKAAAGPPAPGGASESPPPPSVTTELLSPAQTTQADETGTGMAETEQTNEPRDPQVDQLRALFPQVEVEILEAVLVASGGSLDEATEQLLVMNDPEYKPDPVELSQLEADEEYARQLAREDEVAQMQQRANGPRRSSSMPPTQQQPPQPLAYQPYVPRSRRTTQPGSPNPSMSSWQPPAEQSRQQQQPAQERDELAELGEQFSKFAEQGKKTFGSFLTKVKEQVAKVDEAIVRSASPPRRDQPAPPPPPKSDSSAPLSSSSPRDLLRTTTNASTSSTTSSSVVPELLPRPSSSTSNRSVSPSLGAGTSKDGVKPATTNSASTAEDKPKDLPKKDFTSKIPGLLPRQSFSLLDSSSPKSPSHEATSPGAGGAGVVRSPLSAPNHALGDDSDDELEYQRNPFDED
ncbi:hypothetical protein JCM10296v2_001823 [Rhodotorula toruloides]